MSERGRPLAARVLVVLACVVLVLALVAGYVRRRYGAMIADVRRNAGHFPPAFRSETLNQIAHEAQKAAEQHGGEG